MYVTLDETLLAENIEVSLDEGYFK